MTTTTASRLSDVEKLTVLKFLAGGRDIEFVAAATKHTVEQVRQVAQSHGYPDPGKLAWARDVVAEAVDKARRTLPTASPTTGRATARAATPAPVKPIPARPTGARPADDVDSLPAERLIALGNKSTRARCRQLADRATRALVALRTELAAEEQRKREAAERAAQEAKVRDEIARLERELAAQRALLTGKPAERVLLTAKEAAGVDAKTIRAWAAEHDVDCPKTGRVPRRVVDAYLAAHGGAS